MKVKLSEIVNAATSVPENKESGIKEQKSQLEVLMGTNLPIKISYRIKRLADKLNSILRIYNENRNDLIKEFGEEQEDKSISVKDPEKLKLFAEKLQELLQVEEDIDFDKINIEDLGEVVIAPKDIPEFIFE